MNLIRAFMVALALVFTLSLVSAQEAQTPAVQLSVVPQSQQVNADAAAEIAVLRSQLQDARRFQEQILNTVWWALGCVVTLGALLVGYGWFTNQKAYERDKTALENELRKDSERVKAELLLVVGEQHKESTKNLQSVIDQKINVTKSNLQGEISRITDGLLELQCTAKLAERKDALKNGSLRSVLSASADYLELCVKRRSSFDLGDGLDLISDDVHKLLEHQAGNKSATIDTFLVKQVIEALDSVKDSHMDIARQIRLKVLTLRTGE